MNATSTSHEWNSMLADSGNEFADLLDFTDLDFSHFDDGVPIMGSHISADEKSGEAVDQPMGGTVDTIANSGSGEIHRLRQPHVNADVSVDSQMDPFNHEPNTYHSQRQGVGNVDQRWSMPNMIPPTPNSMDLQAGHMQTYPSNRHHQQQQQQQMYEHYRRLQKEQMNFTPLVSPAVTPLETQLRYADSLHDPFSPLTSPALLAQPHQHHTSVAANLGGPESLSGFETRPHVSNATPASARRSRRRMSTSSAKNAARSVKQSPVVKAQQKKKQGTSATVTPKEVAAIMEQVNRNTSHQSANASSDGRYLTAEPSADSVSPESLSEILMPPPVTPQSSSAGRSPNLQDKQLQPQPDKRHQEEPATPASLMRISKSGQNGVTVESTKSRGRDQAASSETNKEQVIGAIELPAPVNHRNAKSQGAQSLGKTNGASSDSNISKPIRTNHTAPESTTTNSALTSPAVAAIAASSDIRQRKGAEGKPKGRESKKRNSMSNENASPAIRPRISPSIKPLLPEGTSVSPETSALLLASKSNYQNILEGTHFPGVSYPENLSTNLTSKRTSHKIAEQGRRNRINTALQEIAQLLPPSPALLPNGAKSAGPGSSGADDGNAVDRAALITSAAATPQQQSNSKASTVEAAIDYIRSLQREISVYKEKLAVYEKEDAGAKDGEPLEIREEDQPATKMTKTTMMKEVAEE